MRKLLLQKFDALLCDNADQIDNTSSAFNRDRAGHCQAFQRRAPTFQEQGVHGHFWLPKYDHVSGFRMTVLRHPASRTVSHFMHFCRVRPPDNKPHFPLRQAVYAGHMSLNEFVRQPEIRHFYSQTMFGGVDMRRFDFIGRFERFPETIIELSTLLGTPDLAPHVNAAPKPTSIRMLDETLLSDDIAFYEEWTRTLGARRMRPSRLAASR